MMNVRVLCAAALLLPGVATAQAIPASANSAASSAASASALLERTARLYTASRALRAEFTQRLTNPITSSESQSAGSYLQRGPGVFSIAFSKPAGDRIVSDGKTLWVFVPSAAPGQVMKMPVGADSPGGIDLVGQFFTSPSRKFAVSDGGTESVAGATLRKLVLVPRTDMGFRRAVLWITPRGGELRQLEVTEGSGVVRTLSFTSIQRNAQLPTDAFTFSVPRGVKVIDQAALMRGL